MDMDFLRRSFGQPNDDSRHPRAHWEALHFAPIYYQRRIERWRKNPVFVGINFFKSHSMPLLLNNLNFNVTKGRINCYKTELKIDLEFELKIEFNV